MIAIVTDMRGYLSVVLICISLIANGVEHIFNISVGHLYDFLAKVSSWVLCPFFTQIFFVVIELYEFFIYFT